MGNAHTNAPGTSTLVESTAPNYLSITINDDSGNDGLNAPNNVFADGGSGWSLDNVSPGEINNNQTSGTIALAINLTTFEAIQIFDKVELLWTTYSEESSYGFLIQRSGQQNNFEEIGVKQAPGNSNEELQFQFINPPTWHELLSPLKWLTLMQVSNIHRFDQYAIHKISS